jgi:hypothetical protein
VNAAYMVSRDVRHLAVWTANVRPESFAYPTGYYRPLCGREPLPYPEANAQLPVVWTDAQYDNGELERALTKPVCRMCLRRLADLQSIADGAE